MTTTSERTTTGQPSGGVARHGRSAARGRWPLRLLLVAWILSSVVTLAPHSRAMAQGAPPSDARSDAFVYELDGLSDGLTDADLVRLRTPQGAFRAFLDAGEEGRFYAAGRVLNLADLPAEGRADRAAELAEKLYFVLVRRLDVNWQALPDRPDGANDVASERRDVRSEQLDAPDPRRNLLVGTVTGRGRPVEIRLERVGTAELPPTWLIARSTVANIDDLYERHGPGWVEEFAPAWTIDGVGDTWLWRWLGFIGLVAASAGVGLLLRRIAARLMRSSGRKWLRGLTSEVAGPLGMLTIVATFAIAFAGLPTLTGPFARSVSTVAAILVVVALTWLGMAIVDFFADYVLRGRVDAVAYSDRRRGRRRLTYLAVARRALLVVVVLVGLGAALAQFGALRTLGASLLASAGVAGILIGLASQDSLANLIAGIQIALTELVQIGDTVSFEGDWSIVEDVTYTYVILRTWDERRIAVPNRHIVGHPLENWDMTNSHMIRPVMVYVDYRTPIDEVRRRYVELLEAADDWDRGQEPSLQVVDAGEDVLQLRALVSAEDADATWRLACHMREELLAFLRTWEDGRYLPHKRLLVDGRWVERSPSMDATA